MVPKFDPLSLLILRFRGRSVAVLRDHCPDYEVSRPHQQSRVAFPEDQRLITPLSTEYHRDRTEQLATLAIVFS
jgi:hypothetical protein